MAPVSVPRRSWLQPAKPLEYRDQALNRGVTVMVNDGAPADADVVAQVLGGDGEAFVILIRRYEPGLLRFATRMLGNPDAAADAVAESLVRAYRHLAQCRDPARLRSWLYRITGNRCRSHLARRHTTTSRSAKRRRSRTA